MIKNIDFQDSNLIKKLFELQRASYLIEAKLINFYEIPPLTETIEEFEKCAETFLGFFEGEELAGALSYEITDQVLTICRMVVHPTHFRKGIAQKLLASLEKNHSNIVIRVSTGRENTPAKCLYLKSGFYLVEDIEVVPGLFISHFEKRKEQKESGPG
jgi:GNAT superfamily N-acetyltransferase